MKRDCSDIFQTLTIKATCMSRERSTDDATTRVKITPDSDIVDDNHDDKKKTKMTPMMMMMMMMMTMTIKMMMTMTMAITSPGSLSWDA